MLLGITLYVYSCDEGIDQTNDQPGAKEVWMQNIAFVPQQKTIVVGTTLTWINKDAEAHTVTSNSGLFDAEVEGGGSFSFTFNDVGIFGYACSIHPNMKGTIVVNESTGGGY